MYKSTKDMFREDFHI